LGYGLNDPELIFFDIYDRLGHPLDEGKGVPGFYDYGFQENVFTELGLPTAPVLYVGPFNWEYVAVYAEGPSTLCPDHVREGVVIRPEVERTFGPNRERAVLKLAGEGYLTRKQAA
jgi:hypothetical protein